MPFLYTSNIPTTGQSLNVTRVPINNNFQAIQQTFDVNHVDFNSTGNGKHKFAELINQSGVPGMLAANEATLYSRKPGTYSDIYFTTDTSGTEYQLTRALDTEIALFGVLTNNYPAADGSGNVGTDFNAAWTFLPGGLFLQYGSLIANSTGQIPGNGTILFPLTFSNEDSVIITISPVSKSAGTSQSISISLRNTQITPTQFKWSQNGSATSAYIGFTWTAIGN
jgi:hypothetical protein